MSGSYHKAKGWWGSKSRRTRNIIVASIVIAVTLGIAIAYALNADFGFTPTAGNVNSSMTYVISGRTVAGDSVTGLTMQYPANYDVTNAVVSATLVTGLTYTVNVPNRTVTATWTAYTTGNRTIAVTQSGIRAGSHPGNYTITGYWVNNAANVNLTPKTVTLSSISTESPTAVVTTCTPPTESLGATYTVAVGLGAQGRLDSTAAAGVNTLTVEFDPAYTLPGAFAASNVTVNGSACSTVSISGQVITVSIPNGVGIGANTTATVIFKSAFGLTNPVAGSYVTTVSTSAEASPLGSAAYTITAGAAPSTTITMATANTPAGATVSRSETRSVAGFTLQRTAGSGVVTATVVTITDTGTVPSTNVGAVFIYRDNGDNTFNSGSDTLLNATGATFSGSTCAVTFDSAESVDATLRQYWVVYVFGSGATNGATASAKPTGLTHTATTLTNNAVVGNTFTIDALGPAVSSATSVDNVTVDVVFSERVTTATAETATNYTIAGLSVSGAVLQPGGTTVRLTTSSQSAIGYTVVVAGVTDMYGNGMQANPNDRANFTGTAPAATVITIESSQTPAGALVGPGVTRAVGGFSLRRTSGSSGCTATAVTVADSGTVPASNVSAVYVYADNGDKTFNSGTDTRLNTTGATFSGASTTVTFDSGEAVDGTARLYWIVYVFASPATDGAVESARVSGLTHTAGSLVNNAVVGNTFTLDAAGPVSTISTPAVGQVVTGTVFSIVGTATDSASTITTRNVSIQRASDSAYWDGSAWGAGVTSLPVTPGANWTYAWTLPTDDHSTTYLISGWAVDDKGNIGAAAQVNNVRVDNVGPACAAASAINSTTVSVTFSERVTTVSAEATVNYTITPTLTVNASVLQPTGNTVYLTTDPQSNQMYTVIVDSSASVIDMYGNHSLPLPNDRQTFLGTDGVGAGGGEGGGVDSGYAIWTTAGPNAGSLPTPHKDFRLTTKKCAVCHATHKGNSDGEALLRGTIANACSYCHILNAVGNIRIYSGIEANYLNPLATAHNGDTILSRCVSCHSVHGADTMTGTVSAKILKMGTFEATALAGSLGGDVGFDATSGVHDAQITVFCTKCHPYYQPSYNGKIMIPPGGASGVGSTTADVGTWQSHVMTTSAGTLGTYGNPQTTYAGQVAWRTSQYCRTCHNAGNVNESATLATGTITNNNFPHYTINSARFLSGALNVNDTTQTIGSAEESASLDGPCLQCHKGATTTGVGQTY